MCEAVWVSVTGDSVVLCVNNLGALSGLEMAVVTRAAISCLSETTFMFRSFNITLSKMTSLKEEVGKKKLGLKEDTVRIVEGHAQGPNSLWQS